MTQSISGLGSGLDTNAIIQQLVALERRSVDLVIARKTRAQTRLASYDAIRSQISALRSSAAAVARRTDWLTLTATSTNEDAVSVSAGSGTFGGSISFTVDRLATAGSIRSTNTVAATSTIVAADQGILVAAGGAKYGFASLASDDDLAIASHSIVVTQASAAAVKRGDVALDASTVIDGTNNSLNVTVNGEAKVLTIANGTYDRTQLAAAVQSAATAAGAAVTVAVDAATNELVVSTEREGSAATVQVTGGSATASLKLSADGAAITGTDGKTKVGDATEQTWSNVEAGGSIALDAGTGTISAVLSGGLRAGTLVAKNVSTGDGSLATVVANINAAGAGASAAAVQVGEGAYRLQITSNTTGASNGLTIAASEFASAVGGFVTLTEAADALVTVGSGPGAYTVTSSSNTLNGLLPGVTATLRQTTASPVTVTASRDVDGLADKVAALVEAANKVKKAIDAATAYNPDTKQASPLTGDSAARRILSDLNRAFTDAVPWATPGTPGLAGISIDKDGLYTFDKAKFSAAFTADPEGMTKVFVQGGSASDPQVEFVSAGDRARAGTYDIVVTTAASQASDVGLEGSWPIGSPPTVRVRIGATEAAYVVQADDLQSDVVTGLNAAFAEAGLALEATVSGTGIEIRTSAYGSGAKFDVAWDGSTWESYTGIDVAGTIDGVEATGIGRQLSIAFDHASLGGLAVNVNTDATGALGTITYQPGVGQRVATAMLDVTDVVTGYLTSSENALKSRVDFIDDQVESMERRLVIFETRLRRQFATLESVLGTLQQQSNWLAGQINAMTARTTDQ